MSNLQERHPPMGSEKDVECQVTSLTSVNEDMITFSSSEEEDELAVRVKTLLADSPDEQISFEQSKTVDKNPQTEDLYNGSNVTIIEDPNLKTVDSSAAPDNSFSVISMTPTSYHSLPDILEKQTVDYDFKDRCCGTNTSHMNLGNEPKVLIQSDLSVRPKMKNISLKNSKKNKKSLKDKEFEMSLKRVSFSSSQTYEGNMNKLELKESSGGATALKSLEHPLYQPIFDLPEECRKHILSSPIYIDSGVLDSNEYSRFTTDNPISSSEVLPHIRWYPYNSYKSSQDFKNKCSQTSLKHSKEVGPSSKVLTEKDVECQVTSLTSVNEDMITFSSSEEEDELAVRVKTLLADSPDEQISFEQSKTVDKNSQTEDLYSESNVTIIEDSHLKTVDSSAAPDNSFSVISMTPTSYYSLPDILKKQTVDYDFKDRCCGTNTSHMNLGNEPKVLIQSDLSVRPKMKNISLKNSKKNKKSLKDKEFEMSLKRVSFSSSQTYEGNMNKLELKESSGGATALKSLEHPLYQPIFDLPEECRKHILSSPIYIDSGVLDSNEYSRFTTDNPISSSEVLPHIRWYPYNSYKSSQDFKNKCSQTSLKHSKEVGPSSKVLTEFNTSFDDSTEATQHLHTPETDDLSPLNFCPMLPNWQAGADIDHPNLRHMKAHEDFSSEEIFEEVMESGSCDNYRLHHQTKEDKNFHDQYLIPSTTTIQQELILNLSHEDASTQTSVCDCGNELKSILKKALKVIDEHVCPCHQVTDNFEHKKETEKVSEKYDILFISGDPQAVIIARDSPLVFKSFLASTVKEESESSRRVSKNERRLMDEEEMKKEEPKKTLKRLFIRHAQNFARKITNEALKGSVNYARNERILRQSPIYEL